MKSQRIPGRRLHKATGYAVVTLNGRDIYLGDYDSPASETRYHEEIARWLANDRKPEEKKPGGITVAQMVSAYLKHAAIYYRKNGRPTSEFRTVERLGLRLAGLFGSEVANEFRPSDYKTLRGSWLNQEKPVARRTANRYCETVKRIFSWAAEEEMIESRVVHGIREVRPIAKGRTEARETEPVGPADPASLELALSMRNKTVVSLMKFQLLTACRPNEACIARPCDIDMGGPVWIYRPSIHKNQHRGQARNIAIGPKCQELIRPLVDGLKSPTHYIFHPWCEPAKPYSSDAYRVVIDKFTRKRKIASFTPNQLRHTALTGIRRRFNIDVARAVAGHTSVAMTSIYAESDDLAVMSRLAIEEG